MRQEYLRDSDERTKDKLPDWLIRLAHTYINTGKPCSCSCCGNPRRYDKNEIKRQEKIELQRAEEQINELVVRL